MTTILRKTQIQFNFFLLRFKVKLFLFPIQVKGVYLIAEQFSIENGLLTPTMKIKRRKVQDTYASEIDSIYEDLANSNQIKTSSFLK